MEQAVQDIPESRHKLTPLYLGATAGMRLLNISKPKESDEILKEVGDKLKTYPFSYKGATILRGEEEGAYGWVTVNYLLEKFIKMIGALDLGGASTQITFDTEQTVEDKDNLMKLWLYGRDYTIYTQSFQCYGIYQTAGTSDNDSHIFSFNNCSYFKCSFNGVFQPNITGNFMAFSSFFYTVEFLQKATGITITSPAHLENATGFQEMQNKFPDKGKYLRDYCADSVFVHVLLISGYGFNNFSFPHISFHNFLPAENVALRKALRPDACRAAIFIFSVLLIASFFCLVRTYYKNATKGCCALLSICSK
ncbi:putative ectonucleoside triphosphate diphosphohydrolase 2 [Triplophysa rosa]|uniref:Ectonucleoside triphosphate diphosphohydrolase 2 n=1 Tax=Triplophysa rosa TaxID=992332 RepID=A0A9W8CAK9_TRIRA|nr:putative ectonucleoside triphosphate diphosphohydrolase 2 [Triplophysa rosa]